MNQQSAFDLPQRIFRKGTLSDIPKWDFHKELQKAICYQKAGGWPEQNSKNNFYSENREELLQATLEVIEGEMTIDEIAKLTRFKENTVYKRVQELIGRGLVDKKKTKVNNRSVTIYWRI